MSLFTKATGAAAPQGVSGSDFGTGIYGELYSLETRQDFVDAYRDRVWVQRSVNLIADSTNQVPIEVKTQRGGWKREHRMLDFLAMPNDRDPAMTFLWWTAKWAHVVGEWYWELLPSQDGGLGGAFPLQSHLVNIKKPETPSMPIGYTYRPDGSAWPREFGALDLRNPLAPKGTHNVAAGRFPSLTDDYYGMPPLRGAKDAVVSDYYMTRYDHRFFRNSARPDTILAFENLSPDERKANKEAWENFKGVDNAHRAAILSKLKDVHLLSQNPRDAEYLEGRRMAREEECAALGVPPVLVGILDRATYSNYEEAEILLWLLTVLPWLEFIGTWTKAVVMPFYPDLSDFRFVTDEVPTVQRALSWLSDQMVNEVKGFLRTPNEGRDKLGLEPDDAEEADKLHGPISIGPVLDDITPSVRETVTDAVGGGTPPADGVAAGATGEGNGNGNGNGAPADPAAVVAAAVEGKHRRKADVERWTKWIAARKKLLDAYSVRMLVKVSQHFAAVEDDLMGHVSTLDEKAAALDLEQLLRQYGWDEKADQLHGTLDAERIGLVSSAIDMTGEAIDYTPEDKEQLVSSVVHSVGNRPGGIGGVSSRVRNEVLQQVQTGIAHGLTHRQIATGGTFGSASQREDTVTLKGIKGVMEEYKTWQAERIARTEAAVSFNHASSGLMREAGITHVDIVDGESDDDCASANGSVWTLEEYESDPIAHPNCTRVGLPRVEVAVSA